MKVPVLFIIFNRPLLTIETFKSIKSYQPEVLYIAADGPRKEKENDVTLCKQTRELILKSIDWDCKIYQLFRNQNIGCGKGVSEAISWMFNTEEYGVIIEDDCSPNVDFFRLCEELLPKYLHEDKVMQINGLNQISKLKESNRYTFSYHPQIWGWATWKRAWKNFEFYMEKWPILKKRKEHFKIFPFWEAIIREYIWSAYYEELKCKNVPRTWDYQWFISVFFNSGLCVVPDVNLVRNIGIGIDATNCTRQDQSVDELQYGKLLFPLHHPSSIRLDKKTNSLDSKYFMREKMIRLKYKILKILNIKQNDY
jgi:hypothetical protein